MTEALHTNSLEAIRSGSTYYRGKPCKHGHDGVRYAINGACVVCTKLRAKADKGRRQRQLDEAREAGRRRRADVKEGAADA